MASNSGTLHIFALKSTPSEPARHLPHNTKSRFAFFSVLIDSDYLQSEWSFAQCKLDGGCYRGAFLDRLGQLALVSTRRQMLLLQFDTQKGGDIRLLKSHNL